PGDRDCALARVGCVHGGCGRYEFLRSRCWKGAERIDQATGRGRYRERYRQSGGHRRLQGGEEPMMFDLTGKTALVTGATGSIGGAIARALHTQGAVVAVSGTRKDALEKIAAELGDRVHVLPCNLADKGAVEALVPSAE